ncbi:MAG: nucleotide sugar dehydrogenase [Alphaproteobacteria bacterium]
MTETVAVIGLGYVGLPVAVAFAKKFPVVGFDISERRLMALTAGEDWTGECTKEALAAARVRFTADPCELKKATFFIVAVPTPIDINRQPDLTALESACRTVGPALSKSAVVVFESTVYPGLTEEICGPLLEKSSGLEVGKDFHLGYSPERINPGDREHTIEKIVKVVAGDDAETLERVARAYGSVIEAGVHRAPSIRVAEAAKVIENTQRDLNIALMNELALIFDRLGISTRDVLAAAATKWNFLGFTPGLVGGHCIGVDPYYLTAKAEQVGLHPQVILSGRRINDSMGAHIAQKLVKMLTRQGHPVRGARVGILGLTFKENVSDLRNSKVPDIVAELREFGVETLVNDPLADAGDARGEYGLELSDLAAMTALDGLVLAVPHRAYKEMATAGILKLLKPRGALVDVKSMLRREDIPGEIHYWSL